MIYFDKWLVRERKKRVRRKGINQLQKRFLAVNYESVVLSIGRLT